MIIRCARCLFVALVIVAIAPVTARAADPSVFTSIFVARWNLNHGEYLVDVGQYLEAIEAFDTAIEMADDVDVQTEAQLQKATVLSLFLDASDAALGLYDDVLAHHPESAAAESAQFRAGMLLFDRQEYARAATYFARYLQRYPDGSSHGSAEFMLQRSQAEAAGPRATIAATPIPTAAPPPPPAALPSPTPAPRPPATPTPKAAVPTVASRPPTIAPSQQQRRTQVRVRVFKGQSTVRVSGEGLQILPPTNAPTGTLELTARAGLVAAGATSAAEVTVRAGGPMELRAGREVRHYRGALTVRAEGNTLRFVNRLGIEEYLYGVVTKESVPSWPLEALKTQAIASRTYALYQVQHRQNRDYDMVDDEGSQVYGGIDGEHASGNRAVDETRGLIVTYGGKPIYAMFTANTGWYTGDPKYIFDQPLAYLTAVPDPYSPDEQLGRWTRTFTTAEVQRALTDIGVRLGPLRAIRPVSSCPSGRIVRVALDDDSGSHVMRTRPTLARALKLPEILVDIRRDGDKFIFAGGGFGHGVGLSQWGAKHMAAKGFTAAEILAFYYRGAQIEAMNDEQ